MTTTWTAGTPFDLWGAVTHDVSVGSGERDTWRVSVATPPAALFGPGPFPYLVVLDPLATFATTVGIGMSVLMQSMGALRPFGIVGVGPATEDPARIMGQRMFDLSPSEFSHPMVPAPFGTGGGDAMLDLIADTVIPFAESEFPLDPTDRGLAGWSLGGLLTAHALLTRRETFGRFLAVSPSLWWRDSELLSSPRLEAPELAGADVYLAVGEHETSDSDEMWPPLNDELRAMRDAMPKVDLVSDTRALAATLTARGDVRVSSDVLAGESHGTVWGAAVTRGITRLFAT